jgi:hypothetical protein
VLISKVVEEIQDSLKASERKCDQLIQRSKTLIVSFTNSRFRVNEKKDSAIKTIQLSRQEMLTQVNDHHDEMIRSLSNKVVEFSQSMTNEENKLATCCNKMELAIGNLRDVITSSDAESILKSHQIVQESVEKGKDI